MGPDVAAPRNNSSSLRRGLRVLQAVADYRGEGSGISLSALAGSLGLSKSTVLRLITPFCDDGLVHRDRDSGRYRLGPACARLGVSFAEQVDLQEAAADLLRELTRRVGPAALVSTTGPRPPIWYETSSSGTTVTVPVRDHHGSVVAAVQCSTGRRDRAGLVAAGAAVRGGAATLSDRLGAPTDRLGAPADRLGSPADGNSR